MNSFAFISVQELKNQLRSNDMLASTAQKNDTFLYLSWLLATLSTAGSFFFSNFMSLPPCVLCWYQRIFMFPLPLVLGLGFLIKDKNVHLYGLALSLCGWFIAVYHNLIYYKWIPAALSPCTSGVSCTERQLDLLGFISIPLMSFLSFTGLIILLFIHFKKGTPHEAK